MRRRTNTKKSRAGKITNNGDGDDDDDDNNDDNDDNDGDNYDDDDDDDDDDVRGLCVWVGGWGHLMSLVEHEAPGRFI